MKWDFCSALQTPNKVENEMINGCLDYFYIIMANSENFYNNKE